MASLGMLQGFRGRADEEFKRQQEQDAKRREQEFGLYNYLMASRDPEIRAMALHGLYSSTQPSPRKGGWGGLMGEIETSSVFPQIRQLAESWVPDEPAPESYLPRSSAPSQPPAQAGSASMAPDSPVEPGAAPMPPGLLQPGGVRLPEEAPVMGRPIGGAQATPADAAAFEQQRQQAAGVPLTPAQQAAAGAQPPAPPLPGMPGVPMPGQSAPAPTAGAPTLPPEMPGMAGPQPTGGQFGPQGGLVDMAPDPAAAPQSPFLAKSWHRRGTGVPTAEEIAEYQARIPTETRIGMAKKFLGEEDARRAILGILGAPQTTKQFQAPTFAVEDPVNGNPVPVAFDYTSGRFYFTDGSEVPRGAKYIRMGGSTGAGSLTSYVEDNPEQRAQLQAAYPGLQLPPGKSPTGYLRIRVTPDGQAMAIPSEFTPPPDFAGQTTTYDDNGVPIVVQNPRTVGGTTQVVGDKPEAGPTQVVTDAQGLLAAVDKFAADAGWDPDLQVKKTLSPQERDAIVLREARKAVPPLPYRTYADLQRAAKAKPETTPRQRSEGSQEPLTMAQKIRATALRLQQEEAARQNPPSLPGPTGAPAGTTIAPSVPPTPPAINSGALPPGTRRK